MLNRQFLVCALAAFITGCTGGSGSSGNSQSNADSNNASSSPFITFDSGQVRPLALSPNARQLLAVNTPAGLLEIL